jgi:hypothetical protein
MRLIIDKNVEGMDYQEIILSKEDLHNLCNFTVVEEFRCGISHRPLNVCIRQETNEE